MNQIQMAQYLTREFLHSDDTVVAVKREETPSTVTIVYLSGKTRQVSGKIASYLLTAKE
jgi:hypothetical protein